MSKLWDVFCECKVLSITVLTGLDCHHLSICIEKIKHAAHISSMSSLFKTHIGRVWDSDHTDLKKYVHITRIPGHTHCTKHHIDGLVQKRRNSCALAMELRLFCIKTWILSHAHPEYMITIGSTGVRHERAPTTKQISIDCNVVN